MFYEENVKEGCVSRDDLTSISYDVKGKRKRLGRALGITDPVLVGIVDDCRGDSDEQSLKILRKWQTANGTKATYRKLAEALLDRTVELKIVVTQYCLKKGVDDR